MDRQPAFVVVTTTVDGEDVARELARKTVENRLAACVQFTSIDSIYRWKGAVESASEYVLLAKTRSDLADDLVSFIRANHSYEVPEITVMPIAGGLPEYLSWISDETAK